MTNVKLLNVKIIFVIFSLVIWHLFVIWALAFEIRGFAINLPVWQIYWCMGGVPVKHHSKGKVGRRRSHLALKKMSLAVCPSCRGPKLPHRTCKQCGV